MLPSTIFCLCLCFFLWEVIIKNCQTNADKLLAVHLSSMAQKAFFDLMLVVVKVFLSIWAKVVGPFLQLCKSSFWKKSKVCVCGFTLTPSEAFAEFGCDITHFLTDLHLSSAGPASSWSYLVRKNEINGQSLCEQQCICTALFKNLFCLTVTNHVFSPKTSYWFYTVVTTS